tara:strand:+ start:2143 stop:2355 length:213 start_codon:yes stop_codon:yes gene_type:complete
MEALTELIQQYGIFSGISIYFIYQTRKDYKAVCDRLNTVEDYVKNTLVGLVSETKSVLEDAIDTLKEGKR